MQALKFRVLRNTRGLEGTHQGFYPDSKVRATLLSIDFRFVFVCDAGYWRRELSCRTHVHVGCRNSELGRFANIYQFSFNFNMSGSFVFSHYKGLNDVLLCTVIYQSCILFEGTFQLWLV